MYQPIIYLTIGGYVYSYIRSPKTRAEIEPVRLDSAAASRYARVMAQSGKKKMGRRAIEESSF